MPRSGAPLGIRRPAASGSNTLTSMRSKGPRFGRAFVGKATSSRASASAITSPRLTHRRHSRPHTHTVHLVALNRRLVGVEQIGPCAA
jgi:hypothetical protein